MQVDFTQGDIKSNLIDGVNLTTKSLEYQYKQYIFSELEALSGTTYDESKVPPNADREQEGYRLEVIAGDESTFDMS